MSAAAPSRVSAPEQLARIIDGLCNAVAAYGIRGLMTKALLFLLWGRLRRTILRVRRLAARIAAGQQLIARQRRPEPPRVRPPPPRLPRGYAWLVLLVPGTAGYGTQLQRLLTDPEMATLANAAPMRRLLRPLCQMLGVPPPPVPKRLVPAPAVTSEQPPPAAHPAPLLPSAAPSSGTRGQPPPPIAPPPIAQPVPA